MTMFHQPVKRTFHRKAKAGFIKLNAAQYRITMPTGKPYDGDVTVHLALAGITAWVKGDQMIRLVINRL